MKKKDEKSEERFVFVTEEEFKANVKKPRKEVGESAKWETGKGVPIDSQKVKWADKY